VCGQKRVSNGRKLWSLRFRYKQVLLYLPELSVVDALQRIYGVNSLLGFKLPCFSCLVRTGKRTPHFTITEIDWLTLFKEIIAVYSENHTTPIKAVCGENA
jgi:hypothetical protein